MQGRNKIGTLINQLVTIISTFLSTYLNGQEIGLFFFLFNFFQILTVARYVDGLINLAAWYCRYLEIAGKTVRAVSRVAIPRIIGPWDPYRPV